MSITKDQLRSFLAQAICTKAKKANKSSEKKIAHPSEQSQNKETVINQEGSLITQKRQDVAILQKNQDNHQSSSNKIPQQNDKILRRSSSTSNNSQPTLNLNLRSPLNSNNTAMKRPFSYSQQLISNNLNIPKKSEINHQLSDKQFSAKTLSKKESVSAPTTKQLSSKQISQSESKPVQIQKNVFPKQQRISSQQSSRTNQLLNISETPLSAQVTKILAAINNKLLNEQKSNFQFQNENTSLEQSQPQEFIQSKQKQQQEQFGKKNNENSLILSLSNNSLIKTSKNKQTQHFIERKSLLNKPRLMKHAYQYQKCFASQFFVILNETIIEQIIRFLPLKDIAKFATLSRKTRKIVPGIISRIDYKKNIDKITQKIDKQPQSFGIVNDFVKEQQKILKLLKLHQDEIQQLIEKISLSSCPDNQQILAILKAGVLIHMNLTSTKIDVVDYIKKVGILKVFSYLFYDHITPFKLEIKVPPLPFINSENRLYYFVRHIVLYLRYYQKCTLPVHTQRMCYREIQLREIRRLFMQQKKKALVKYSKPIIWFHSSSSNIKDFLNKNILSVIITFLNPKELSNLSMSSKMMKAYVKESLLELLPSVERQQSIDLEKAGISRENAQTMVYLMHFEWYYAKHNGIIVKKELNKLLIQALLAAGIMFAKKEGQNNIYSKYGLEVYESKHRIIIPQPNTTHKIVKFLKEFPTLKILKDAIIKQKSNIVLGVYLYYYIRGLQKVYELSLNGGSLDIEIYNKVLFKNDCKIYCYKKLIGIKQDDLLVLNSPLTVSQQQIFKERTGLSIFSS